MERLGSRFAVPAAFVFIHCVAVVAFAIASPDAAGPNADSAAMAWSFWALVDFPLGVVALFAMAEASTNFQAIFFVLLFGGLQWMIWGLVVNAVFQWVGNVGR
ncbi:hypothetical protein K227x_62090 [Rubripirellula lacrimiformis]|uniref:Uncharacterized protein n=1 Tax=Rubripirellula lacrimiformis TaxID=1930273 RepID=A0A517NKY1_9BACT|nr:hypothetical protein [Rubripirellula lacrimiformis]QDT07781.1 hypothetical protein K227x_62090 [Rubripirellula lacrimiformis]